MAELERAIVERARAGERRAQEAVLRRYVGPLHGLARRLLPFADPDDATQELLSHLLEALPDFGPGGPAKLTTWVFTLAHRKLIDLQRKRRLELLPLEEASQVADSAPCAEKNAASRQFLERLDQPSVGCPMPSAGRSCSSPSTANRSRPSPPLTRWRWAQ